MKSRTAFDLESCQNVSISDCHLDCGDDAIAITNQFEGASGAQHHRDQLLDALALVRYSLRPAL